MQTAKLMHYNILTPVDKLPPLSLSALGTFLKNLINVIVSLQLKLGTPLTQMHCTSPRQGLQRHDLIWLIAKVNLTLLQCSAARLAVCTM